ncbi:PDZ domain-containing protein [Streptomyces sp. NPDC003717]|uniref:PDZ domain-containing protein n=1 Tax=Streptomyces sp. NPDC003717 TaxID=3154276 RepID=UPI0033ABA321
MEQTALRPKPMPGGERGTGPGSGPAHRPHAPRRRRRRVLATLAGLLAALVLLLAGFGLGTMGAAVIGMSKLAEMQRQAGAAGTGAGAHGAPGGRAPTVPPSASPSPGASAAAARATLGVEAVDDERPGAVVVGVHVPGPGYTAGLVRGDVLLTVGKTRVDSAADLARAVSRIRPGKSVKLTVRHESGAYQQLSAVPGIVT